MPCQSRLAAYCSKTVRPTGLIFSQQVGPVHILIVLNFRAGRRPGAWMTAEGRKSSHGLHCCTSRNAGPTSYILNCEIQWPFSWRQPQRINFWKLLKFLGTIFLTTKVLHKILGLRTSLEILNRYATAVSVVLSSWARKMAILPRSLQKSTYVPIETKNKSIHIYLEMVAMRAPSRNRLFWAWNDRTWRHYYV